MRHRLIHPIKIIIQQPKQVKNVESQIQKQMQPNTNIDLVTRYKLISLGLSGLLAISESLSLMSDIKSNGLIHIIQDILKEPSTKN